MPLPLPPARQLGLGDDQHRSGYEAALDPWLAQLWPALRTHFPLPPGVSEPAPGDTATELVCKYQVTWLTAEDAAAAAAAAGNSSGSGGGSWAAHEQALEAARQFDRVEAAANGLPAAMLEQQGAEGQPSSRAAGMPATTAPGHAAGGGYGPRRPCWARLAGNRRITAAAHFQDVRQLEIDLGHSGLVYQPGDVLALVPQQPAAAVDALLRHCGWDPQAWVRVEPAGGGGGGQNGGAAAPCSATVQVGALVAGALDINGASPRRVFFQVGCGRGAAWQGRRGGAGVGLAGSTAVVWAWPLTCIPALTSPHLSAVQVLHQCASAELEVERLAYFSSPQGRDDLYEYNAREGVWAPLRGLMPAWVKVGWLESGQPGGVRSSGSSVRSQAAPARPPALRPHSAGGSD